MNKTVIANWNSANKGKSETIYHVYQELCNKGAVIDSQVLKLKNSPNANNPYISFPSISNPKSAYEVVAVVMYKKYRIGICSYGDPYSWQQKLLPEFKALNCDIIITSTRTSGMTVNAVYNICKKNAYDLIWLSGAYFNQGVKNISTRKLALNQANANYIVSIVDGLISGKI